MAGAGGSGAGATLLLDTPGGAAGETWMGLVFDSKIAAFSCSQHRDSAEEDGLDMNPALSGGHLDDCNLKGCC